MVANIMWPSSVSPLGQDLAMICQCWQRYVPKMPLIQRIALIVLVGILAACGDECSDYSDFSCDEIQSATYNIYFYYPNGEEEFLGTNKGLNQCGTKSYRFAASKGLGNNNEWSYICCMQAKGSECYEKHR